MNNRRKRSKAEPTLCTQAPAVLARRGISVSFPSPKVSLSNSFISNCLLRKILLILPAVKGCLEKAVNERTVTHQNGRQKRLGSFLWESFFTVSSTFSPKPIAKRVLSGKLVNTPKWDAAEPGPGCAVSLQTSVTWSRWGDPDGSPNLSVIYCFSSLWSGPVSVFTSVSTNCPFGFPWNVHGSNGANSLLPWSCFLHPRMGREQGMKREIVVKPCSWVSWLIFPAG